MFKIWCESDILSEEKLREVHDRIETVEAPSDLGRLPGNINSNYGGFAACQGKNWVLYYSLYAVQGIWKEEHVNFVLACRHLREYKYLENRPPDRRPKAVRFL